MTIPEGFVFFSPVKINAGTRAMDHIPFELEAMDARKPLIVARDRSSSRSLIRACADSGMSIGVFDRMPADPDADSVTGLSEIYTANHCDALIAAGSGPMVAAVKALRLLLAHPGVELAQIAKAAMPAAPMCPMIVVPTAGCNGLETSRYASVGKIALDAWELMPDLAVIDPRMLKSGDVRTVAGAALCALAHGAEACVATPSNPVADMHAAAAVGCAARHLLTVTHSPSDKAGRLALVSAAVMAGCAVSNTEIGMAGRLGAAAAQVCPLLPGFCNGLVLPYALEYQILKQGETRTANLLMALAGPDVYASTAANLRGPIAVNMIYALLYDLNKASRGSIPLTLRDAGLEKERIDAIVDAAIDGGKSPDPDGCRTVMHHAWEGRPIISL